VLLAKTLSEMGKRVLLMMRPTANPRCITGSELKQLERPFNLRSRTRH